MVTGIGSARGDDQRLTVDEDGPLTKVGRET